MYDQFLQSFAPNHGHIKYYPVRLQRKIGKPAVCLRHIMGIIIYDTCMLATPHQYPFYHIWNLHTNNSMVIIFDYKWNFPFSVLQSKLRFASKILWNPDCEDFKSVQQKQTPDGQNLSINEEQEKILETVVWEKPWWISLLRKVPQESWKFPFQSIPWHWKVHQCNQFVFIRS